MMSARAAVAPKPIDEAIRTIPSAWFKPDPRIYWTDMLLSAATGWTAFVLSVRAATPWGRGALLIVAAFALYRAVLFIHELTHLALHELPAFRTAWNALVGIPLLLPSFLYEGVHTDHHRQRSYGTPRDPEYVPFGRRPPVVMASYALGSAFLPLALAFRFGVVAPSSWLLPPLRRLTIGRVGRELLAPVGLRYHALHHWIPSLPYHNLGRSHRLLLSVLGDDTPYIATQYPAMAAILIDLVQRARRHTL